MSSEIFCIHCGSKDPCTLETRDVTINGNTFKDCELYECQKCKETYMTSEQMAPLYKAYRENLKSTED